MALGRPQIVTSDDAFTRWGDTPTFNTAAVAANRLSRDRRIGRVAIANSPDADAHRGFGPFPPIAVGEAKRYFGPKVIKPYARNAAQQRWTNRKPRSFYTVAPVIGQGIAFGGPALLRTRSHAPAPVHSKLRPPVVVNPEVVAQTFSGPSVTLAPAPKPRTLSRLYPPTVLAAEGVFFGPDTHLAPSRRGVPKSLLRPPVAPETFPGLATTLAPSRRPVTKSHLGPMGPPALVHAPLSVNLTYSRRGKPLSGLGRPVVLNPNRDFPQGPMVSLAPSSRGKPKSRLRPPVVVGEFVRVVYAPLQTTLAPSSRLGRRARSFYSGPAVLADTRAFGGIGIWLTQPSRRFRLVRSRLRAPAVLRVAAVLAPITVTLARIRPQRTHSRLLPPAVVGPGIYFRPIKTKLVRIRPASTHPLLRPPADIIHPCFGCVTGYDYGPWATGSDSSNLVTGSDSGALVSGSDSAGTALGAAEPGGNVEGGDARREGC